MLFSLLYILSTFTTNRADLMEGGEVIECLCQYQPPWKQQVTDWADLKRTKNCVVKGCVCNVVCSAGDQLYNIIIMIILQESSERT